MSLVLALLSALVFGVSDFIGGFVSRRVPALRVVVWSELVGLGVVLVAAPVVGVDALTAVDWAWSSLAGVTGAVGFLLFFRGLSEGRMGVVSPLSAVVAAVVPVTVGLSLGERPSAVALLGVLAALPGIWLVSSPPSEPGAGPGGARFGIAAGVGFGLFAVAIAQTPEGAGLWPLAVARLASIVVMGALLISARHPLGPPRPGIGLIAVVGIGDMVANILFLVAVRIGLLTLVPVVLSLYPAFTVLLAVVVLGERIHRRQGIGLSLAAAAVVLIALA